MNYQQMGIIAIITGTVAFFIWGRWRHDIVAMGALLACVFTGLVPGAEAFSGFGHPAVVTVACVLVLSYGLQTTGAVSLLAARILPRSAGPGMSILALTALGAVLSGFMNNVGALALLMPVGIQIAERNGISPGKVLMPLAFGSILGGTTTLIGTPPNLIISGFRSQAGLGSFSMFDFTPVGATTAFFGVLFIGLIGWRLVPEREQTGSESFETGAYLSEVRVSEDSPVVGKRVREVEDMLGDADAQILGMVRGDMHFSAPGQSLRLRVNDILVIEAEPEGLSSSLYKLKLKLEEALTPEEAEETAQKKREICERYKQSCPPPDEDNGNGEDSSEKKKKRVEDFVVREMVPAPGSGLDGLSATDLRLRTRFGVNLLAISRKGYRSIRRLRTTPMHPGDVLLLQGTPEALSDFASQYDCLPLAARDIRVPRSGEVLAASTVMAAAVALAAFGIFPAAVAFAAGALAMVVLRIVPLRSVYTAVDWPVVILLAAMLPVAGSMASTGAADLLARFLLETMAKGHSVVALVVILASTMLLTDFMNNAATAAVMAPIALSVALHLEVNPDTFLMAVAIGASCAFLTPIGHQNNTLILGPGGFSFGDYWIMGLPTDILVILTATPMLLLVWPLQV